MSIVDKIDKSLATIQELALLSGVSADKMYKWRAKRAAPNADDIVALEEVFREITNLSKDQIKVIVSKARKTDNKRGEQALKIATGNSSVKVEDLEGDEGSRKYINSVNNGTNVAADNAHQQPDQAMENKILEILDRVTRTADKWADKALIDAQNQAEMINLLRRSKETVDQ